MSSRNLSGYRESEPRAGRALTLCEGSNELLGCRRIEDGAVIPYFDPGRVSILADSNDQSTPRTMDQRIVDQIAERLAYADRIAHDNRCQIRRLEGDFDFARHRQRDGVCKD